MSFSLPVASFVLLVLAGAATGCSSTPYPIAREADEVPVVSSTSLAAAGSQSESVGADPLGQFAMLEYARSRNEALATCLQTAGFPQMVSVEDYNAGHILEPRLAFGSFEDPLDDFRPATPVDAESGYGPPLVDESFLRSSNNEFDISLESCREVVVSSDGEAAKSQLMELLQAVYNDYVARYETKEFDQAVLTWTTCISEMGFTLLDGEAIGDGDIATAFGIELGRLTADEPIVDPPELEVGEIRVEVPPSGLIYVPTEEEVELARADVECKVSTGLLQFAESRHRELLEDALEEHGDLIGELKSVLQEAS